ncbi:MAG TPA: exodeoxyribonuclease III [Hyphomicrobiaceae bacterium]|nr:exodeoxyribonuclease III [Hyphomicrobiaceae bacterium]
MRIATWNINGAKARLEGALTWLKETDPDVACFQEIKSTDEAFPAAFFEELGYHLAVHGQKGFNGVAVLSKRRFDEVVVRGLPGDAADAHARYIEVVVPNGGGAVRIGNLYLPNGNPIGTDRFAYKLAWMRRFEARARELLSLEEPFLLMGDYNVIPEPADAKNPDAWREDALFQPETRAAFRALINLGLTDAVRACQPEPGVFTFWDYQAGAWQKDHGIRIDHILLSPQAADRLLGAGIDKFTRGWEKPSDHVPVWVELEDG